MIREALGKHYIGMNKEFRFRGEEPGRLENFSDAVFALAVTLLLISTSAPSNFEQIKRFAWELIPFCVCIVLIILIWHEHFVFFYRYGLRNAKVIALNTLFLIIVLFYVYPLKFIWKILLLYPLAHIFKEESILAEFSNMFKPQDMGSILIIYGTGAASIFIVLMLMYRYALKKGQVLDLNSIEEYDTRESMTRNFIMAIIPTLSVILAIIFINHPLVGMYSGFIYFLYPPMMAFYAIKTKKSRNRLLNGLHGMANSPS